MGMEIVEKIGERYLLSNVVRASLLLEPEMPIPVLRIIFSDSFYVNTWPTKRIGWVVKLASQPDAFVDEVSDEFLEKLFAALRRLPERVALPPNSSMPYRPRYYHIVLKGSPDAFEVATIVGVRSDLTTPTKWAYDKGYWHPKCIEDIVNALKNRFLRSDHE